MDDEDDEDEDDNNERDKSNDQADAREYDDNGGSSLKFKSFPVARSDSLVSPS